METPDAASPPRPGGKLLLGIVGGLIIVALIGAGVILIPRLIGPSASAANITASAMPADTQFYFSFNPHFQQLPNGEVLGKAWDLAEIGKPLEDNVRHELERLGFDWDQDIAPWLGDEVGLGVGDLPATYFSPDAPPPFGVLAVATRDTAASNAMLAKLRARAESEGVKFTEQTHRETPTLEGDARWSYATVKGLVIVASRIDVLHQSIDAVLDDNGFDQSVRYQEAIARLRGGRAMTAYGDMGALLTPILDQMTTETPPAPVDLAELGELRIGMGVSFEPNGVLTEFVTPGDPSIKLPVEEKTGAKAVPNPNRLLRAVPASTLVYMSGRRVSDWYDDILGMMEASGVEDSLLMDSIADFERQSGIDLREDIFGWMIGEAAAAVVPGSGLLGSSPSPFGFALIVEASDKQRAEAGPHKLFRALAAESGTEIVDVTVAGHTLHGVVDASSGDPVIVYGLIGDNFVLALPESAAEKIAQAGENSLADDETFKAAIAPLPGNTIGYVYLKPKPIVDLASVGLAFSGQECEACPLFEPIRALAFTVEYPPAEPGVVRSALFMLLDVE